ncbi:hypothetical protein LCGC14_0560930 [marine sediment metagenome]|uniref:Uncharacterized protein n=1 Tax=marine sediment metagenome TaxID=412755 RepID=A0A0F9S5M8_9ZZZZ
MKVLIDSSVRDKMVAEVLRMTHCGLRQAQSLVDGLLEIMNAD